VIHPWLVECPYAHGTHERASTRTTGLPIETLRVMCAFEAHVSPPPPPPPQAATPFPLFWASRLRSDPVRSRPSWHKQQRPNWHSLTSVIVRSVLALHARQAVPSDRSVEITIITSSIDSPRVMPRSGHSEPLHQNFPLISPLVHPFSRLNPLSQPNFPSHDFDYLATTRHLR
jgi:hypothetical protein